MIDWLTSVTSKTLDSNSVFKSVIVKVIKDTMSYSYVENI